MKEIDKSMQGSELGSKMDKNFTEDLCFDARDSPPAARRRSTFFEKRASIMPETIKNGEKKEHESENHQYNERMSLYLKDLQREDQSWKDELQNKKMLYQEAKQRYESKHDTQSTRLDYSLLTPEDINLMKSKPSLPDLAEMVSRFECEVKLTLEMYNIYARQKQRVLDENHSRLDRIHNYILDNSRLPPSEAATESS